MIRTTFNTARLKTIFGLCAVTLIFGLSTSSASAVETDRAIDWRISSATLINAGSKQTLAEGSFLQDLVTEAKATSTDLDFIPQGKLRLTMSVFTPNADRGVQKKGMWYVTGKWELVDDNADPAATGRNLPGRLNGLFNTELSFDPTHGSQSWQVATKVPFSTYIAAGEQGTQKLRGDGSLSFGSGQIGKLSLQLKLLPKIN